MVTGLQRSTGTAVVVDEMVFVSRREPCDGRRGRWLGSEFAPRLPSRRVFTIQSGLPSIPTTCFFQMKTAASASRCNPAFASCVSLANWLPSMSIAYAASARRHHRLPSCATTHISTRVRHNSFTAKHQSDSLAKLVACDREAFTSVSKLVYA